VQFVVRQLFTVRLPVPSKVRVVRVTSEASVGAINPDTLPRPSLLGPLREPV
jgi:hypothetical protein